jgi:3'-phosphoadenosine 5'-phosphosulfate sulfotransferase (PAPS reductase)/FAD synthetase
MLLQELGELRLNMPVYRRRMEKAKETTRSAFMQCEKPYVAVSGGKDSIAMLGIVDDVAKEIGKDYEVWAHLSDASFPGTEETIREACQIIDREPIIDWSPVSAFDVVQKGSNQQFGKKGYFFDAIKSYVEANERDLVFIGVRAQESKRRTKAVRIHGQIFKTSVPSPITVCYPLAYFEIEDVAAAIIEYGLPFHPIYYKKDLEGNPLNIRLGYVTAKDLLHRGTAVFLKLNYPELYNKLAQKWPEVRNYT